MSKKYSKGTKVEWDWGNGTATGEVTDVYEEKTTHKIKGNEVTRNASSDDPAYMIKQDDGDRVLKSHSEVRKKS